MNLVQLSKWSGPELESELAFSATQHVLTSGIVQNIKFSLQQLNMQREALMQKYTDKHPDLVAVNQQIADLHADLKRQVENAYLVEKVSLSEMEARRAVLERVVRARVSCLWPLNRPLGEPLPKR